MNENRFVDISSKIDEAKGAYDDEVLDDVGERFYDDYHMNLEGLSDLVNSCYEQKTTADTVLSFLKENPNLQSDFQIELTIEELRKNLEDCLSRKKVPPKNGGNGEKSMAA